jgi:hypothetical protein
MAKVTVRRGSEGPRHDPYGYTEVIFTKTNGDVIQMHMGLGVWLKVNGKEYDSQYREEVLSEYFKEFTGMAFEKAERIPDVLEERYVRRLSKEDRHSYYMMRDADERLLSYAL